MLWKKGYQKSCFYWKCKRIIFHPYPLEKIQFFLIFANLIIIKWYIIVILFVHGKVEILFMGLLFGFFFSEQFFKFSLLIFLALFLSSFHIRRTLLNLYYRFSISDFSDLQRLFFKIKTYLLPLWCFFAIETIFIFIHLNISFFSFTDFRVQILTEKVSI